MEAISGGVSLFVKVDNILNKIHFAMGGFNQILDYTDTDKGYLSGGIQILEEIYGELTTIKNELKSKQDVVNDIVPMEIIKEEIPTVRVIKPAELKSINTQSLDTLSNTNKTNVNMKHLNLPNIIDTSKSNTRPAFPIPDTPRGFNTIPGLDKLTLPKPNIMSQDKSKSDIQPVNVDIVSNQIDPPMASGYKLSPEEATISNVESDILQYLMDQNDVWSNISQICKGVNKVRATVNKYIKMLSEKGFVIHDVVTNRKTNTTTWKLDRKYSNDIDRLKFIITLSKK